MGDFLLPVPPGLSGQPPAIGMRAGFVRPLGTSRHPFEFAVVASTLPLAAHYFLYPRGPDMCIGAAMSVGLLLVAVPVSLSRSSVVSLVAAVGVLGLGWSWRRRANGLVLFLFVLPVVSSVIPGVVEALIDLFTNAGQDASLQAIVSRLAGVTALVRERPWFGLGFGTPTHDDNYMFDIRYRDLGIVTSDGPLRAHSGRTAPERRRQPRHHVGQGALRHR